MANTTRSFSAMLGQFVPNKLLKEELVKRNYLLTKVDKDDSWATGGGATGQGLVFNFKGAGGSSVKFGALTTSTDISESVYVRGEITTVKEAWGSMIFNHRDIMEHGKLSEQNFLKILPDEIEDFTEYMNFVVSLNLLNGTHVDALTVDGTALGVVVVARPDRFQIGQKVFVDDDDSAASAAGYVRLINVNTGELTIYDARTAGAVLDLSAYTVAQNAKIYGDGQQADGFSNLRDMLLSAANGGSSTIFGVTKTSYPYTQSINISGAAVTAANLLQKIFDGFTTIRKVGRGKPTDILMSYKHFGTAIKIIESSKGGYNVVPGSRNASQYGWDTITIGSVAGQTLNLVGIYEMNDDVIMYIDWRALTFYSNGFFRKRVSPDGIEYFEIRNTTGYQYIVDICLFGELVLKRPSYCGIMYSIPSY